MSYASKIFGYDNISNIVTNRSTKSKNEVLKGFFFSPDIKERDLNIQFNKNDYKWFFYSGHIVSDGDHELVVSTKNSGSLLEEIDNNKYYRDANTFISLVESLDFSNIADRIVFSNTIRKKCISKYFIYNNKKTNEGFVVVNKFSNQTNYSIHSVLIIKTKNNIIDKNSQYPSILSFIVESFEKETKIIVEENYHTDDYERKNLMKENPGLMYYSNSFSFDLRNANPIKTEISEKEIPLIKNYKIFIDNDGKEIEGKYDYTSYLFLGKISDIKNIEFLNHVDTRNLTGDFILEYSNSANFVRIFRRIIANKKIKNLFKKGKNPVLPVSMYSLNNQFYANFDHNERLYDLKKNIQIFIEKIKDYNPNKSVLNKIILSEGI